VVRDAWWVAVNIGVRGNRHCRTVSGVTRGAALQEPGVRDVV